MPEEMKSVLSSAIEEVPVAEPVTVEEPPKPQIKPVLSSKKVGWKKFDDGSGMVSHVRGGKGGLAVIEGDAIEGYFVVLGEDQEKLGPFYKLAKAKAATEDRLHSTGRVYYREETQNFQKIFRQMMRKNHKGNRM